MPSGSISQNEIDAARTVRLTYYNTQEQQRFVWPPSLALARAYKDWTSCSARAAWPPTGSQP